MGKMDEQILAVDRAYLFEDELLTFQGVITDQKSVNHIMKKFKNYFEVRRGDAEENQDWKQPIPYAVLKRGDEVFVYKRLSGGGETRLHDQLSIGVGGHMNRINDIHNWNDNLKVNFYRELGEELDIKIRTVTPEPKIIGLINDDKDDAGLFHIGILMVLELPEHTEVTVRETEQLEGYWLRARDLTKSPLFESLETWSQFAVEVI
jgi:predicted NUDIX family phosphoesterase